MNQLDGLIQPINFSFTKSIRYSVQFNNMVPFLLIFLVITCTIAHILCTTYLPSSKQLIGADSQWIVFFFNVAYITVFHFRATKTSNKYNW